MGKLGIGLLAFAGGALVGAVVVGLYFKQHALSLVGEGIAAKIFGEDSQVTKSVGGVLDTVQGVFN